VATERESTVMFNTSVTAEQYAQLIKPINPSRVKQIDGMSHLEAYDVKAHLIRVFGFGGWSSEVTDSHLMYEEQVTLKNGKPGWRVGYRVRLRLGIHQTAAQYEEEAFGESQMPDFKRGDCHHMALTTAASTALKRCAINLGDQFGLSLYNNGSPAAVVRSTLVGPETQADPAYIESIISQINNALSESKLKDIFEQVEKDGMLDASSGDETLRSMIIDRRDAMRGAVSE
jgi:hypothetical protein